MAVLPGMTPLALSARHIVLNEHQVALLEALAPRELAPGLGDIADVLVPHDGGLVVRRMRVKFDIGAADASDLHLQQRAVGGNLRHRVLADFGLAGADSHGGKNFFHGFLP